METEPEAMSRLCCYSAATPALAHPALMCEGNVAVNKNGWQHVCMCVYDAGTSSRCVLRA